MTKEKTVKGVVFHEGQQRCVVSVQNITLRVTVDGVGASLSLSDDKTIMLEIPLEDVSGIITPVGFDS